MSYVVRTESLINSFPTFGLNALQAATLVKLDVEVKLLLKLGGLCGEKWTSRAEDSEFCHSSDAYRHPSRALIQKNGMANWILSKASLCVTR